jgi:hypothetical protein
MVRGATRAGEDGRAALEAARELAARNGFPDVETLACCELALQPGGDLSVAIASFTANEARLDVAVRREARFLLWKATGDRMHLAEAKRLLDEAVAGVPDDVRESMLANLRGNRAIAEAAKAEGL